MGAICSNILPPVDDEKRISDIIDKEHQDEHRKIAKDIKILLLGTGESGKSTIMKQLQILYNNGFDDVYRQLVKPIIYRQILKNIKILIRESENFNEGQSVDMELVTRVNQLEDKASCIDIQQITAQVWEDFEILWKSTPIKNTFNNSNKFTIDDSTDYFLDKISVLKEKDYIPNDQDILRARILTPAIVETIFEKDHQRFKVLDVGGQRSERRKWIYCFPDVTVLIFVVAISEYDQFLREDMNTRRLDESLRVYSETVKNKVFKDKIVILCFNKMDIFERKIKERRNFSHYYPEFKGTTKEETVAFIQSKFSAIDKRVTQYTIATDTDLFKVVFDLVINQVLHDNLRYAGFIRAKSQVPAQ